MVNVHVQIIYDYYVIILGIRYISSLVPSPGVGSGDETSIFQDVASSHSINNFV